MKRLWFVFAVVFSSMLLSGCLGATTHIEIREDGSGSIAITYRISKLVAYVSAKDGEGRYLSIPLNEKELLAFLEPITGATLKKYTIGSDDSDVTVSADINFDSLETLKTLFGGLNNTSIDIAKASNGETLFTLTIYDGLGTDAEATVREMVTTFFSDYDLAWNVRAPSDIISTNTGSMNGRQASVSYHTADVLLSSEPVVWEVRW